MRKILFTNTACLSNTHMYKGSALATPGWPMALNFCSGATRKSMSFPQKSYAGHPEFHRFRALGSLQFFLLRAQPCV